MTPGHDNLSLPALFEQQVRRSGDRPALCEGSRRLSYRDLDAAANRLAHALRAHTTDASPVALLYETGIAGVTAVLATLKAGRPYVQLDPDDPPERLRTFVADAGARVIVTGRDFRARAEAFAGAEVTVLDHEQASAGHPTDRPAVPVGPDELAWIHFTSGSTGRPKGVMQRHGDSVRFFQGFARVVGLSPADRTTMIHTYMSLDLYPPLLSGSCIHVFDLKRQGFAELNRWLAASSITILSTLPSVLRAFVAGCGEQIGVPSLRLVRLGGEGVVRNDIALVRRHFSAGVGVLNWLGSTESGVAYYLADGASELDSDVVPAGRPIDDTQVSVVDDRGRPVAAGETGEIVVTSRYLFPGYWRNPELTDAVIAPDPADPALRSFRTGDVGRWRRDGLLEHLGRKDFQLKIQGHRVEPGEVEAALLSHPEVEQAAVVGGRNPRGEAVLLAFVVPVQGAAPGAAALKQLARARLPDYLVPARFELRERFPTTTTGKIDRRALAAAGIGAPATPVPYRHPADAVEVHLKRIWEELLGTGDVGVDDDFFECGGDSLAALTLVTSIEQQFGVTVPVDLLWLEGSTIRGLGRALRNPGGAPLWGAPVPLKPGAAETPLFAVHVIGGHLSFYVPITRHLGPDQAVYGLQAGGLDGTRPPDRTIEAMASHTLHLMRQLGSPSPHRLLGYSSGGLIALEMARALRAAGERVAPLVLLDCELPRLALRDFEIPREDLLGLERWRTAQERLYHLLLTPLGLGRLRRLRTPGESHRWAYWSYRPRPYDGDVVLLMAAGSRDADRMEADWRRVVRGRLTVEVLPGDHLSLVREPTVRDVAKRIQSFLDGAEPRPIAPALPLRPAGEGGLLTSLSD